MSQRASGAAALLGVLVMALAGCGRDPYPKLVEDCTTKSGAWRYGTARGDVVLLSVDQDPLDRPDSSKAPRVVDAPLSASWMLEQRLDAVEFPLRSQPGFDPVGRVSLLDEGDPRCLAFARDPETLAAIGRLGLTPPQGFCVGLERGVRRQARYAVVTLERIADGALVNELVDLQTRRVLARVVNFVEPGGRSCGDTPKGEPAANAMDFVMASLEPDARNGQDN